MEIINTIIALLFFLLGYLIKYKKKYDLIAGYSDYSPENEEINKKYNMKKLGNVVGNSAFIYGIVLILLTFFKINQVLIHSIALGLFLLNLALFSKGIRKSDF